MTRASRRGPRARPRQLELIREGARQALSRRWLAAARVAIVFAAACAAALVSTTVHRDALAAADRQISLGRQVTRFVGRGGSALTASSCDAAGSVPGVIAAGGFTSMEAAALHNGVRVQVTGATPGFVRYLLGGATLPLGEVLVGRDAAERAGIRSGSPLVLGTHGRLIARLLPATPRGDQWANTVLYVRPPAGTVGECWVEVAPSRRAALPLVNALLDAPRPLTLGPVDRDAIRETPEEIRAETLAPARLGLAAGAAALVVTVMAWWALREGWALYLAIGFDRSGVARIALVDWLLLTVAPTIAGTAWGGLAAPGHPGLAVPTTTALVAATATAPAVAWLRLSITRVSLRRSLAGL